jgi:hypothetical protein
MSCKSSPRAVFTSAVLARTSPARSSFREEFEVVIMIEVVTEEVPG